MKKIILWTVVIAFITAIGGGIWWIISSPEIPESEIISRNGIHWHPELTIYVKGVKQDIPAGLGLGVVEQPIHTHDEDARFGVIHLEFPGIVTKSDITLGQFLKVWHKDMYSFGKDVAMTVNGKENSELGSYVMHDKDKIELRYE